MAMAVMGHQQAREALDELQQALAHHEEWFERLNRTLVCGLAPDPDNIATDAHCRCRFGRWFYDRGRRWLAALPGGHDIEAAHQRMHDCARSLLVVSNRGERPGLGDYERFTTALKQMRLEVLNARHDLEDTIYHRDPLTGAASRIGMLGKLREQHAMVSRKVHNCCVAMMDVDHFKRVNDTYGHAAGDRTLADHASHAMSNLRPYDLFFRYGGEEFLIGLVDADLGTGHGILDRLRQELAAHWIETGTRGAFQVTASFGLTLIDPDVTVELAIERADKALYAAKSRGRNRVEIWEPSLG